jgi:hypothetical protein
VKKFLIVGCGGSGGATLRYLMDQLRADLRPLGVDELPPAWQFLQIDVNPDPEETEGLGSIRNLGGRYLSVSSPGNAYTLVANNVEQSLITKSSLRSLLGWTPAPKQSAAFVGITKGAGQYRAVGRMLTLTDLNDIQEEMKRAWQQLQRPDAWGDLPTKNPSVSYDAGATVIPMVVGSMAGGSGASMFLDVCRLLGRLPGLNRADLGVFLFTADVFAALPSTARTGVDGNALGAIGEIIAAQTRASDAADSELFSALGIPPEPVDEAAFARIFPIGSTIGGDGAKFGDGTPEGVFRGLGRALAATMSSDEATTQYVKSKIENPTPPTINRDYLGWGTDAAIFPWGSFGYASLSLGRDRYAEYASQRIARNAFDRLCDGHLNPASQLPSTEQLNALVDSQWSTILGRLNFPAPGSNFQGWFKEVAFPSAVRDPEARRAIGEAVSMLGNEAPGQAGAWVESIRVRLPYFQQGAADKIQEAAFLWANGWAGQLEHAVQEEFLRSMTQLGIPYARALVIRLRSELNPVIDVLRRASAENSAQPLAMDPDVTNRALALKKTVIGAGHAIADFITQSYFVSAQSALTRHAARLAGEVLSSFANDVLGGLERVADNALLNLEQAKDAAFGEAGLAQLATAIYSEWPQESDVVPARFDQADNEVLLTTSRDFPAQFQKDVTTSVPSAGGIYSSARQQMVGEVIIGRWETTGGAPGHFDVLTQRVAWRPAVLPVEPISKTPTPASQPVYDLGITPGHLLRRAREHLRRPGQPFQRFSGQSIEEFLKDPTQPEAVLNDRAAEFVQRFQETMKLARPLVGVSPSMIQVMHPQNSLIYEYSFSDIPISRSSPVVARIRTLLEGDSSLDTSTVQRFDRALEDSVRDNRIAMFGSYPKYSPLVFNSLLEQIQKRWTGAPEQALSDLWQWKRTRPLPASLAMGALEQRAMVAGWFLGRLLGAVIVPKNAQSTDPVQVWDFEGSQWLAFPERLLTPPARFGSQDDWLPAVLESQSLAIVQCNNDVSLNALRSYRALRSISDDSHDQPGGLYAVTSGVRNLAAWLSTGVWPTGKPSEVVSDELTAPDSTPAARAESAKAWLRAVQEYVGDQYLTVGGGVGALSARKARIDTVADLAHAPMFAEIAELVHAALGELVGVVDLAMAEAGQQEGGPNVLRPVF